MSELTAALATLEKCREITNCPAGVDLQDHLRQLVAERDAALNAERAWETAMMEVCGEDGPASVASEIRSLQALRDTAMQALKSQVEQLAGSRTVTDWIEHDGKWRPESLGLDELVYLKTRKQALKIPYPAGKVKGWVHRGCAMDVMAYKLASPQARTVTVKLPEPVGVIGTDHWIGEMNMRSAVIQELKSTGIKWEAD